MGSFTKFLGRLLFVTVLVSSAYFHISKPQDYKESFAHHYEHFLEHTGQHLAGIMTLPVPQNLNWNMWVQIFGAFQGLIALLIFSGDRLGGILLLLSLAVSATTKYCHIENFVQWQTTRQLEFAQFLVMIGASLALGFQGQK